MSAASPRTMRVDPSLPPSFERRIGLSNVLVERVERAALRPERNIPLDMAVAGTVIEHRVRDDLADRNVDLKQIDHRLEVGALDGDYDTTCGCTALELVDAGLVEDFVQEALEGGALVSLHDGGPDRLARFAIEDRGGRQIQHLTGADGVIP